MTRETKATGNAEGVARRCALPNTEFDPAWTAIKVADQMLGEYRWLMVRAPGNKEVSINLEIAKTEEEKSLVGRQGAAKPLLGITTDDCKRDYVELKRRGVRFEGEPKVMPYGTGVMLQDLYGNKIYLNQDHA